MPSIVHPRHSLVDRGRMLLRLAELSLSQAQLARLEGVNGRTVRRRLEGSKPVPAAVLARLDSEVIVRDRVAAAELELALELVAGGRRPAVAVYRRDDDLPPWIASPTASAHAAAVVVAARQAASTGGLLVPVLFDADDYRRWRRRLEHRDGRGSRPDDAWGRALWASWRAETAAG